MKFKVRKPSIKKKIAARTSVKRAVRHRAGLKAPRGAGIVTSPKRAVKNRVYNRTTRKTGCVGCMLSLVTGSATALVVAALFLL